MMQLAHIQRHFFGEGVGMRQIIDYYLLLRSSKAEERAVVSSNLRCCGLLHIAGALMWMLSETLHLNEELMISEVDEKRGRWLYSDVMDGGNFGRYGERMQKGLFMSFFKCRFRQLSLVSFDYPEGIWMEIVYWKKFFCLIPKRIIMGRLSLSGVEDVA